MIVREDVSDPALLHHDHRHAVDEGVLLVGSSLVAIEGAQEKRTIRRDDLVCRQYGSHGLDGRSAPDRDIIREKCQHFRQNGIVREDPGGKDVFRKLVCLPMMRIMTIYERDEKPRIGEVRQHYFAVARRLFPYTNSSM